LQQLGVVLSRSADYHSGRTEIKGGGTSLPSPGHWWATYSAILSRIPAGRRGIGAISRSVGLASPAIRR